MKDNRHALVGTAKSKFLSLTALQLRSIAAAAFAIAAFATAPAAHATLVTETFDTSPTLSATQAPGVWYTDRFAPAGFTSTSFAGDNRLALTLSTADGGDNRPGSFSSSFYNTQGRKFDIGGATSLSVDFYIDSAFGAVDGRIGGLWGTGVNGGGVITAFPIIEFHGDGLGSGAFNIWDGANFVDVGLPPGFAFDVFYTMSMNLVGNTVEYGIDGTSVFTDTDSNGTTALSNVILQGINTQTGVDRTLYFDNLTYSAVPTPATLLLLLPGLAVLALRRRRAA
jgi:hypothetical protein